MYNNKPSYGGGQSYKPKNGSNYKGGGGGSRYQGGNNRKPEHKPERKQEQCITIVLDSETPQYIIDDLVQTEILTDLEATGVHLRIGMPEKDGLDTKAIREKYRNHMFMVPWKGFNDVDDAYCYTTEDAKGIYKANSMSELSDAVLTIASLKVNLLLGESCENPSLFLLTWTNDGAENARSLSKDTGYLSVLIKLAGTQNIKVLNLNNAESWGAAVDLAKRSTR